MSSDVSQELIGRVSLITINRAEVMNSLDFEANEALIGCWRNFAEDSNARVAVITGGGDQAFCAGADLKTYTMAYAQTSAPDFRRRFTDGPGFGGITRGMTINKPIIAAINGYCISGGLELALACDIRFCGTRAEFGHQDVRWGFHPCDGGCVRLPAIVGLGNAMEMILSGERIDAKRALAIGLVNRVFPADRLLSESLAFAARMSERAPVAQQFAKEVILRTAGLPMEEGLNLESRSFRDLGETLDLEEGTAAFAEKRAPSFEGR